jgi:hypothetical protein
MRFPTHAPGRRCSRPTERGGLITIVSIMSPIVSERSGDTVPPRYCAVYWDGPTPKRCSLVCCMPRSSPVISTSMDTSGSGTGGSLGKMGLPEKRSACGSMRKPNPSSVQEQTTALCLCSIRLARGSQQIVEVKNARRRETHFRSPQLDRLRNSPIPSGSWLCADQSQSHRRNRANSLLLRGSSCLPLVWRDWITGEDARPLWRSCQWWEVVARAHALIMSRGIPTLTN